MKSFRVEENEKSCEYNIKPWSRTCKKVNWGALTQEAGYRWRTLGCFFGQRDKLCAVSVASFAVSLMLLLWFVMSYISLNDPTLTSRKGTNFHLLWWRQQGFNNKSITLLGMFTGKKAIVPFNCMNRTVCLNVLTEFNLVLARLNRRRPHNKHNPNSTHSHYSSIYHNGLDQTVPCTTMQQCPTHFFEPRWWILDSSK